MGNPVVGLLRSKKAIVALAGIVAVVATRIGLPLDPAEAEAVSELITGIVAAYLVAQGAADVGKHRPPNTDLDGSGQ